MAKEKVRAGRAAQCAFGSLADNQCPNDATWLSTYNNEPTGAAWCDEHKPVRAGRAAGRGPGRHDLVRIGDEPVYEKLLFPNGGRPDRRGRPPNDPSWAIRHFTGSI